LGLLLAVALSVLPATDARAAVGDITTVAGSGPAGSGTGAFSGDGGPATSAQLSEPAGAAVDAAGNLFIADQLNNRVRKVTAATGVITTVAGTGTAGFSGDGGPASSATLSGPSGVAVDAAGNLFIADVNNHRVRKVAAATGVITTVAGTGIPGFAGDGGPATSAQLDFPTSVAVDGAGNLFIADINNHRIRKVAAATGVITTVAGGGNSFPGDGGLATSASLRGHIGLAIDAAGNLFIADHFNSRVRKVATATGVITTVAGSGTAGFGGFSGDGGPATSANLSGPSGVAVDAAGNLFIADVNNHRVRKVAAATGVITTVAGSGTAGFGGFSGDGGPAASAQFNHPIGVAVDSAGNLFIADMLNHRVRRVAGVAAVSSTQTQSITLISGSGPIGGRDCANLVHTTSEPSHVVAPHPSFNVIPGTQYINSNPNIDAGPFNSSTSYRTSFTLPVGFSNPSLTIQIHADNVATIFLNDVQIGQQTFAEIFPNFQDPPESFTATNPSLFQAGQNSLRFDIHNFRFQTAFDYKATVSFRTAATVGTGARLQFVPPSLSFATPTTAGATLSPQPRVEVVDALGNRVTTAADSITIAIGANPGGGTLSGSTTVNAVNGVATFPNLSINAPGGDEFNPYTLVASSGVLTSATSLGFIITTAAGVANKLEFRMGPNIIMEGEVFSPALEVVVQDAAGNTVPGATNSITITGEQGGAQSLLGTTTVSAVNGVAVFSNLSMTGGFGGNILIASTAGLQEARSRGFSVFGLSPGFANRLGFLVQPSNTAAGASIAPPVQVEVRDNGGNRVSCATNAVTITATFGTTLSGTTTVNAVNGVATFANLRINPPGIFELSATGADVNFGSSSISFRITEGTTIRGTVTLQGRTATSPPNVGHSIATVTMSPGNITANVAMDGAFQLTNVQPGTFTVTASALGYLSAQKLNVQVGNSAVVLPAVQLLMGRVNDDDAVTGLDLSAVVQAFGSSPQNRMDGQGRFVDQNGDGAVTGIDLSGVVSNFGLSSPQVWP
jgi:hypothetical protein